MKKSILLAAGIYLLAGHSFAQEENEGNSLILPEDLSISQTDKYQLEELRVGGRLERVTVRRKAGFTEIYQNQREDSVWYSEENQLGDNLNVRQWKLGGW